MTLDALWTYPLKAARGLSLTEAEVETRGLVGDRRWMLVDSDGRFMSQRSHPRLARVRVEPTAAGLRVEAPEAPAMWVERPDAPATERVVVWDDSLPASPAGADADAWFTRYLGTPCHLVYLPDTVRRPVDPAYASSRHHVSFADGFPVLVIGTASLADLNGRLASPVTLHRFRPNVVVRTEQPFVEDTWRRIRVGEVVLDLVKPCARCVVTTIDPETAEPGREPLRTLATYRRQGRKVLFGQNALVHRPGWLRVGTAVEVLESKEAPIGQEPMKG
ncbi:MAG: MOSC domain-containing protein [Bacteroidetes bacterium]|nr:MAG: MOSC domain-containing protein [Bacteroidota bacterium]